MTRLASADDIPSLYDPRTPSDGVYLKIQHIAAYIHKSALRTSNVTRLLTLQEIKGCKGIKNATAAQQQFLATYHGVIVDRFDRVTRIAYAQYTMDLHAFTYYRRLHASHVPGIIFSVRRGMAAHHSFGIVHCDIRPVSSLLRFEEQHIVEAVIGDFDAARREGQMIKLKKSSEEWWPREWGFGDKAVREIDVFMVEILERWLERRAKGDSGDGKERWR